MSKHSFMDTILNRPSQRYTEPDAAKSSSKARYKTPNDLPNAPNKPNSILAGTMFTGAGPDSLNHAAAASYSRAPSVMSVKSNTSRFSIFRKKTRQPSISGGSAYYDGSSSIAPTELAASPRKGRWWESGTRNTYSSRPPSVAGSFFSEPEATAPPGFPRISDSLQANAPPRGARSDYGATSSTRKRYSSRSLQPPVPPLVHTASMSSMKRQSGVMPLGQQQPNLMRQASSISLARSPSNATPNAELQRPISPPASIGNKSNQTRHAPNDSSDWNSFVKSMSGTEVAKMWESMPTMAPKPPRASEKRSSIVANRVRKELEQDAQFQQIQHDPGLLQQDLLARAASQVIGAMPPTPVSPISEPQMAPVHLQPGHVVAPISPIHSPIASHSSLQLVQHPQAMLHQYSAPVPATALYQYTEAVSAPIPQQVAVAPLPAQVPVASPALPPTSQNSSAQIYAPVAMPAASATTPPLASPQHVKAVLPPSIASAPQTLAQSAFETSITFLPQPTLAHSPADHVEQQESGDEQAQAQSEPSDESEDSDDASSEERLVSGGQPALDVVAEEDEEVSSAGHDYHHEMRSRRPNKGNGLSRNYDNYEARLHSRQVSAPSQQDYFGDEEAPLVASGVQIHVTEPCDHEVLPMPNTEVAKQQVETQHEAGNAEPEPFAQEVPKPATASSTAAPALASAAPRLVVPDKPPLVSRTSEFSDYQSASSGRSTPTAKRNDDDDDHKDGDAAVASTQNAEVVTKASRESMSTDAASIAPSQHPSVRTTRSVRPGTVQRRLSELSLGTSFAASGILRRPESSRRNTDDSDSDKNLSDDDADLRAQALAEQDRLRKMNVGDDFFGPSFSSILDKFDDFSSTDSAVSRLKRDPESQSVSADRKHDAPPAESTALGIDVEAQQVINEVRQNRANATVSENRRNSAETAVMAPSLAAVWLLNHAQNTHDSPPARELSDDAVDETITAPNVCSSNFVDVGSLPSAAGPQEPKVSVLNRPRPKATRPHEMGGLSISEGKLEAEKPKSPVVVEDTRSTLPVSISRSSIQSSETTTEFLQSTTVTPNKSSTVVASKDKPAPIKSALKPKPSRSLADTLFSMSFRSPAKEKKEKKKKDKKKDKKDKTKHGRNTSVDSLGSASIQSQRSSSMGSDSASVSAAPAATAETAAAPLSAKALGKQRMTDDADSANTTSKAATTQQLDSMVPSGTVNNFATPLQSMANLQTDAAAEVSPEKFHTAHDLTALADTAVPVYPTNVENVPPMPNGIVSANARPDHQRQLSEQMKSMESFGSFTLPQLDQHKVADSILKRTEEAVAAAETVSSAVEGDAAGGHVDATGQAGSTDSALALSLPQNAGVDGVSIGNSTGTSSAPTMSEASVASTALTSPEVERASKAPEVDQAAATKATMSQPTSDEAPSRVDLAEKKLPIPPPPGPEEVMASTHEDRTPTGKPRAVSGVGINLIPPTPPALESRRSFTSSQVPGTPSIAENEETATTHQRPPLLSRSSSQRTAVRGDTQPAGPSESLSRSKSMAPAKKGMWTEYKGKGLSLPPGLVATTIDSSALRRMSTQDKRTSLQPASMPSYAAAPALPVAPIVNQNVATAPLPLIESPSRPVRSIGSQSPRSKRSIGSLGGSPQSASVNRSGSLATSPSMNRIMADAPPVPQIPAGYQTAGSVSSSSSRLYTYSVASSEQGWDSRSASPAPSAVPSQSARSIGSHVSSSVHSVSHRSSPKPEYSYVNHHELSPYAKKMRSLSPSPAVPTLSQTGNRHSLMSAINEWESQVPETEASAAGLSPYPSRPTSPSPPPSSSLYPPLPASTVSRASSVISSMSSPAVVRNAPLGAATNQYLSPPAARPRISSDELAPASESPIDSLSAPLVVGRPSGPSSMSSSSPSASQSALSLPSTVQTSMPTVPTSYRPNKDPKRFSTNADGLLNNRTTMQTVAVTSGAFTSRSKSVVRRKKSVDLNGSPDMPEHLLDELSQTTLSITAHTPPPRKIGSQQVLVQVIAVAIDEMDKLLLREKVRAENGFGYVPGRSFCGRIVECGYEVKKMRKGDVVFGLQDSRKCGALSEFMVVDHNRICQAPSDCLTTEQIAALPSAGVMAHQLVQNHCSQLQRGARVLMLNAHDGVGLLTMQASVGLGLVMVAQCPPSIADGVAVCQANGAHEVVIGEPLWAINSLHESSFDLIIDTVGGRKIYDASRRILGTDGQFCTCFGDEHGTANPNLKSHLRSLRRAFFKKDKKNIGYEWVGVDTAEDCREALEAVKIAAEQGAVCPRLRSVLPFSDAGRAFDVDRRNADDEPGAIVVRVS